MRLSSWRSIGRPSSAFAPSGSVQLRAALAGLFLRHLLAALSLRPPPAAFCSPPRVVAKAAGDPPQFPHPHRAPPPAAPRDPPPPPGPRLRCGDHPPLPRLHFCEPQMRPGELDPRGVPGV